MSSTIPEKVLAYETFLNETLREDLRKLLEEQDKLYGQIAEYLQLKTVIERIQDTDYTKDELKTKVDIGCNFYVQANVPDASRIYVSVGFGFFVEFKMDEALRFIGKKTARLNDQVEKTSKDVAKVKAHIKLVLEGLREMQGIGSETPTPFRDIFS
ncbi:protein UXT homolog [Pecten maximus]|uniref:protein UXT homolog n=1 Tax=Pecten maximus TaxID=6579 RepID=UPI0014586AED|nr:protein UXT homolog [Pecten maximus]